MNTKFVFLGMEDDGWDEEDDWDEDDDEFWDEDEEDDYFWGYKEPDYDFQLRFEDGMGGEMLDDKSSYFSGKHGLPCDTILEPTDGPELDKRQQAMAMHLLLHFVKSCPMSNLTIQAESLLREAGCSSILRMDFAYDNGRNLCFV